MSKPPGPLCTSRLGGSWIDEGTSARTRHSAPGPVGIDAPTSASWSSGTHGPLNSHRRGNSHSGSGAHGPLGMLMSLSLSATPTSVPNPMSMAGSTLNSMREIQNYKYPLPTPSATAPDLCLAAASFVAAKLTGLTKTTQHLNDFLSSSALKGSRASASSAWGHLSTLAELNSTFLPAVVAWGGLRAASNDVEFFHLWNSTAKADALLLAQVPLVVGVSLEHISLTSREHFILLVADSAGSIWAVDSWGETGALSTVAISRPFSFRTRVKVAMNAGQTIIPCANPFFGYFREKSSNNPLKTAVAL